MRAESPGDSRDLATLLAMAAATLLFLAISLPWWAPVFALALLGWRAARRRRGPPPRAVLLALLVGAIVATVLRFHTVAGRDAGVALLAMLIGLKALEARGRRDSAVLVHLGLFAVAARFLYDQGPLTALIAALLGGGWLLCLLDANLAARRPPLATRARLVAGSMLLGLPVALSLFVLFPRLAAPAWAWPGAAGGPALGDTMDPGSIADLARDDSIAFRARFAGPPPAPPLLYWRGPVLEVFDGRRWSALPRAEAGSDLDLRPEGPPLRYTVSLEPTGQRSVFALDAPLAAPTLQGQRGTSVTRTADLELRATRPLTSVVRYSMVSSPAFVWSKGAAPVDLELPPGADPRARALADRLAAAAGAGPGRARRIAAAVLALFHDQPFRYTLDPGRYPGPDPVDAFLFDRRAGFCEHYAQAMVVLLRASGVPARVVTGYQGGRLNPIDGDWVVRQSDAHAWVEYWSPGAGWLRADPTAAVDPSRVERSGATLAAAAPLFGVAALGSRDRPWLRAVADLGEAFGGAWNRWVVDYGDARQAALLGALGLDAGDALRRLSLSLAVLGVLALLGLLTQRPRQARADAWERAYAALRARLARAGITSEPGDAPASLAARLGRRACAAEARALLAELERLRYGRAEATPQALRRLRRRIARMRT